jgi:hypothetical protein
LILEVINDQFSHGPTPENYVLIDYAGEGRPMTATRYVIGNRASAGGI